MQEVYINLDDSGKLTFNEKLCVYGGVVFFSKSEKDEFINKYRSIVNQIKDNYDCEIKSINIRNKDKRRLINFIKKHYVVSVIFKNDYVYSDIKKNKASKGRFVDYGIKMLIKNLIIELINERKINPYKNIKIIINIDEQSTKSNGYYNLKDSLYEELKYGVSNFNYGIKFASVIKNDLDIVVNYQDSKYSFVIQASDLVAGVVRKTSLNALDANLNINDELHYLVNFSLLLP